MQFFTRVLALAAAAAPLFVSAAPLTTSQSEGRYIVQLKPGTDAALLAAHHNRVRGIQARNLDRRQDEGATESVERKFDFGEFKGYCGSFDVATVEALRNLPEVLLVEKDHIMTTNTLQAQFGSPPGLGSISSRTRSAYSYIYDSTAGQGTYSYIVDTGIRTTHRDFGGRATWGYNAINNNNTDNMGHGTHVAGIVGGATYGVAKRTNLIAVKVFEGRQASTSQILDGFQWAINDIVSKGRQNAAVINMSLGGPGSAIWDAAIASAWNQGILAVVAAGNENQPASNVSPARSPEALCVGNAQPNDSRYPGPSGSNYGSAVDIWAIGTGVVSTYFTSDTATATLTGTSMAAPHVAGLVSYLRGLEGLLTASEVKARVIALATPDRLSDVKDSVNLLAYNGNGR